MWSESYSLFFFIEKSEIETAIKWKINLEKCNFNNVLEKNKKKIQPWSHCTGNINQGHF